MAMAVSVVCVCTLRILQTGYKNLGRGIWPLVDDPHGIGSEHVPWVRPKVAGVEETAKTKLEIKSVVVEACKS